MPVHVLDRLLGGVDHAHGQRQSEKLGGVVVLGGVEQRVGGFARQRPGAPIDAKLDSGREQVRERARKEGGGTLTVHEQGLGRVANPRAAEAWR